MRLTERFAGTVKGVYQSFFERPRAAHPARVPEKAILFPRAKKDFGDGAYGTSGFDLANAFAQGVVEPLDILEITTESSPPDDEGKGTRLFYLEPGHPLFHGANGYHIFLAGLERSLIKEPITSWKKVGSLIEELKSLSDSLKTLSPKPLF